LTHRIRSTSSRSSDFHRRCFVTNLHGGKATLLFLFHNLFCIDSRPQQLFTSNSISKSEFSQASLVSSRMLTDPLSIRAFEQIGSHWIFLIAYHPPLRLHRCTSSPPLTYSRSRSFLSFSFSLVNLLRLLCLPVVSIPFLLSLVSLCVDRCTEMREG